MHFTHIFAVLFVYVLIEFSDCLNVSEKDYSYLYQPYNVGGIKVWYICQKFIAKYVL